MSPERLRNILATLPAAAPFANLMVGTETSDDAAIWRLNDQQALVATTDFFMPMVDDPFDFGRIAAANALSDVYAMGGRPILALAILGMPVSQLSDATIGRVLAGGAAICAEAGIPVAGGHSIDSVEPIYGLVALGLVNPDRILTNRGAQAGDCLILTKGLGTGVLGGAFKRGELSRAGYAALMDSTTRLNTLGARLPEVKGVHAVTDVTGFGLLGHGLEMARGGGVTVEIDASALPLLDGVAGLARAGKFTGASARNRASQGEAVHLPEGAPSWLGDLLSDPQTSGGLLISVAREEAGEVLGLALLEGFDRACVIGRVLAGPAVVDVKA